MVKFEFIRMRDSTGFGDDTESGQVIPVSFAGQSGGHVHSMCLDGEAAIAGGPEIWGFPKKLAAPALRVEKDMLIGTLDMGSVRLATGSMGYKYAAFDPAPVLSSMKAPGFLLKVILHVDCTSRICGLVRYCPTDLTIKGEWSGPAAQELHDHARAPVADLPVREVISVIHILADLPPVLGEVVQDHLEKG